MILFYRVLVIIIWRWVYLLWWRDDRDRVGESQRRCSLRRTFRSIETASHQHLTFRWSESESMGVVGWFDAIMERWRVIVIDDETCEFFIVWKNDDWKNDKLIGRWIEDLSIRCHRCLRLRTSVSISLRRIAQCRSELHWRLGRRWNLKTRRENEKKMNYWWGREFK